MKPAGKGRLPDSRSLWILGSLGGVALAIIVYRFLAGLGATTNLSDAYPWGFWIGIDVLVGIALAAGGFVITGLLHLFGGGRFRSLSRPAILTALLGYLLFIGALMVDLGRPWNIWKALISWNHASPMFEVAWCVMFYTSVLVLEFIPPLLEALGKKRWLVWWHGGVPYVVVVMLTLFCYAMTQSPRWAALTLFILSGWESLFRMGVIPRGRQMPLLLIMAGVMLSTMHQSSLGTLFLAVDHLNPLWYTPVLPLLFFTSAVMAAPAVVILEASMSARALGAKEDAGALEALARGLPYVIGAYLALRLADILLRQEAFSALTYSLEASWWWLEVLLLLGAMALLLVPGATSRRRRGVPPSILTVGALVTHRLGVSLVGIEVPGVPRYVPAAGEVLVTLGILAIGVLVFRFASAYLPIHHVDPSLAWSLQESPGRADLESQPAPVPEVVTA